MRCFIGVLVVVVVTSASAVLVCQRNRVESSNSVIDDVSMALTKVIAKPI